DTETMIEDSPFVIRDGQQDAKDEAGRIDYLRDGGQHERLARLQNRHRDRRAAEEDRLQEHNARQVDDEIGLRLVWSCEEWMQDDIQDLRREDEADDGQQRERSNAQVERGAGDVPGRPAVLLLDQIARKDRDKRRGQRATRDDVEDDLREDESIRK